MRREVIGQVEQDLYFTHGQFGSLRSGQVMQVQIWPSPSHIPILGLLVVGSTIFHLIELWAQESKLCLASHPHNFSLKIPFVTIQHPQKALSNAYYSFLITVDNPKIPHPAPKILVHLIIMRWMVMTDKDLWFVFLVKDLWLVTISVPRSPLIPLLVPFSL